MSDPNLPSPPPDAPRPWLKIILGLAVVALIGAGLMQVLHWLQNLVGEMNSIGGTTGPTPLILAILVLYALLIACPFMPGIEVGVALLLLQGATIAPLVYLFTVLGLLTAYLIGRLMPLEFLHRIFYALRLRRACAFVAEMQTLSPERRLAKQRAALPPWLAKLTVDYRYISIGILLNVPGTFAIGGGGGILLAAGLSRLFNGWGIVLTLLVFTLPVPLTVWLLGSTPFG